MNAGSRPRKDYVHLDGLRAVAATAVVCFHYCPHDVSWLNPLIASGPAAVGFFFLLSGFVLAQRYPEVINRKKFWSARFLRVYPMYLVALLLYAPIAFQKFQHDPKTLTISFLLNISMLQAWTSFAQSWNGPSWSLSVEAFLYAIFPFLVARIDKARGVVYWGLLAMVPPILTIGFCNQWIPAGLWQRWIGNNPLLGVPAFSFGIALGLFRMRRQPLAGADLKIAACLGGIVVMALVWPPGYREVFVTGGAIVLLGRLIVLCTYRSPVMQTVFGNSVMVRLGKASYITYIMQSPLWHYYQVVLNLVKGRPLSEGNTGLGQFLIFVPMLLVVSVALERFVDEPVRAALSSRTASAVLPEVAAAA